MRLIFLLSFFIVSSVSCKKHMNYDDERRITKIVYTDSSNRLVVDRKYVYTDTSVFVFVKTDSNKLRLNETYYLSNNGKTIKQMHTGTNMETIAYLDSEGYVQKTIDYTINSDLIRKECYFEKKAGNITKVICKGFLNGKATGSTFYLYDYDTTKLNTLNHEYDGELWRGKFSKNLQKSCLFINENDILESKTIYRYQFDERGRVITLMTDTHIPNWSQGSTWYQNDLFNGTDFTYYN
jgi:hypothetical protein